MSVDDLRLLQEKTDCITVKFPKSNKLFIYEGDNLHQYGYNKLPLYQKDTGHLVETTAKELLVEMNYHTYQLHQLMDDADYQLALELIAYYMNQTLPKEGLRFVYLLGLIIDDYERQHYPITSISTVNFIDYLLEEKQQTWKELQEFLGYESLLSTDLESSTAKVRTFVKLSHFFKILVQAFIVGGYGQ